MTGSEPLQTKNYDYPLTYFMACQSLYTPARVRENISPPNQIRLQCSTETTTIFQQLGYENQRLYQFK